MLSVEELCCFQVVVLEKILKGPLDSRKIKPVNSKGKQPWIYFGSTGAEAGAPILWPPDVKNTFVGKDPVAGKVWGLKEKGVKDD